nr:Mbeg1-like protein [Nitrospirillum sp. BR 11163]
MVVQNNAFETVTKASVRQAGQLLAFKVGNSSIQFTPDNIILSSNGSTVVMDKDGIRHKGGKIWLNMKEPADSDAGVSNPETAARMANCAALADARDNAVLANHTYGGDPTLPPGYRMLDPDTPPGKAELAKLKVKKNDLEPPGTSFRAQIFAKDETDGTHYVVAYRGTQTGEDWKNNLQQGLGEPSAEYKQAITLAHTVDNSSGGKVSFTGHSLGGGMASAASVATGKPATTFNAAGLNARTVGEYPATPAPVNAYYNDGDPLSGLQDNRETVLGGMTGAATVADPVAGAGLGGFILDRESKGQPVLPQAYGTRHELPKVHPAGAGFLARHNPVAMHGMDYVIRGIDAKRQECGCP